MDIEGLLAQVKATVQEHANRPGVAGTGGSSFDANALIGQIEQLFEQYRQPSERAGDATNRLEPHGMDPYGGLPDESGKTVDQGAGL